MWRNEASGSDWFATLPQTVSWWHHYSGYRLRLRTYRTIPGIRYKCCTIHAVLHARKLLRGISRMVCLHWTNLQLQLASWQDERSWCYYLYCCSFIKIVVKYPIGFAFAWLTARWRSRRCCAAMSHFSTARSTNAEFPRHWELKQIIGFSLLIKQKKTVKWGCQSRNLAEQRSYSFLHDVYAIMIKISN